MPRQFHHVVIRTGRKAFTLIELMVVMTIISLLMSILVPVLKKARDQAKAIVCAVTQHGFGTGLSTYFAEDDEWIPGRNTTGFEVWKASVDRKLGGVTDALDKPHVPVQTYDWMTPILRTTMTLAHKRSDRFRFMLDEYKCASVNFTAVLYSGSKPDDEQDFVDNIDANGPYPGISYLMPAHFQFWGDDDAASQQNVGSTRDYFNTELGLPIKTPASFFDVEVKRYKSKVANVGAPSEKIAVADGTRYLPKSKILDFDHHEDPEQGTHLQELGWYGSFTSSGAWYPGSTAYGTKKGNNPSLGKNLKLTYRHDNAIQAVFFDGHVEKLSQKESREISYWYPRGARIRRILPWYDTDLKVGYVVR